MVQPEFQTDVSAAEAVDLFSLIEHQECVDSNTSLELVYESFQRHHHEYVAVISKGLLIGMISRGQIGFLLGSRFGFAVYSRYPVSSHLMEGHLRFHRNSPLLTVLKQALSREGDRFYEDVALVDANEKFLGIISVPTLVRWQSKLILEKTHLAERQRRELQENNKQLFRSLNELRQSRGRYEILFENSALGVALLNAHGEIETCNRRFETLLGIDSCQPEGSLTNLASLVVPSDLNAFHELLQKHEENLSSVGPHNGEFMLNLPGRGPRLFKFFTNWISETGQICALLDDITETRVLEHRMIQKEKSALLDSLVGGIAHEINNKLAPIIGYADLLTGQIEKTSEAEKLKAYCQTIRESAIESAKIIRQLLHLSKPMASDFLVCDLRSLVREASAILRFRLREGSNELLLDLPQEEVLVVADASQLKQVIINLMINALDAMENVTERRLRLTIKREQAQAVLVVADSGHGIKPENISRIFDPFFTTKSADRGSGLGLSVCLSIIKHHGGEITVTSTAGKGAEFRVTLPLSDQRASPRASAKRSPRQNVPQFEAIDNEPRARVLIVDDEEFITGMVQEALRLSMGCTVEKASGGRKAIAKLQESEFDLVVSDIRMPGMDGLELFEWIKSNRPKLVNHFLLITGDAGSPDLNNRIEFLEVPVLRKPFDIETLLLQCQKLQRGSSRRLDATVSPVV
jgi:signal transduction histidine kinase/ActR/RegA family two-component response regulator